MRGVVVMLSVLAGCGAPGLPATTAPPPATEAVRMPATAFRWHAWPWPGDDPCFTARQEPNPLFGQLPWGFFEWRAEVLYWNGEALAAPAEGAELTEAAVREALRTTVKPAFDMEQAYIKDCNASGPPGVLLLLPAEAPAMRVQWLLGLIREELGEVRSALWVKDEEVLPQPSLDAANGAYALGAVGSGFSWAEGAVELAADAGEGSGDPPAEQHSGVAESAEALRAWATERGPAICATVAVEAGTPVASLLRMTDAARAGGIRKLYAVAAEPGAIGTSPPRERNPHPYLLRANESITVVPLLVGSEGCRL